MERRQPYRVRDYRDRVEQKLDHIHELLHKILERDRRMEQELQRLADNVAEMSSVVLGADTLLDRLSQMIRDLPTTDPATQAKITELADAVAATKATLAASVAENTPAADEPPVE